MNPDADVVWRKRARRAGGSGVVLGMVLLAVGVLLHPSEFDPAMRSQPHYVAVHFLIALGLVLALPGLLLLLGRLLEHASAFDVGAALLCTFGWTLFTTQIVVEGLVVPVVEARYGIGPIDVLDGPASMFYLLGAAGFAIGFPLAGWRLPRKGAPAWPSRLLMVAPIPVLWPPAPDWLGKCGVVIFAVGLAWLGAWLGSSTARPPSGS